MLSGKKVKVDKNGKPMSPKQKKIASAAPPRNKITGADFKALRKRRKQNVFSYEKITEVT